MPQTTITLSDAVKRRLARLKPDALTWDEFLALLPDSLDADAFEAKLRDRFAGQLRALEGPAARPDLLARLPEPTPPEVADALQAFLDGLDAAAGDRVEQVILYGSMARGEADAGSDVDVLVVWRGDWDEAWTAVTDLAHEVFQRTGVQLSAKAVPKESFDRFTRRGWTFYRTVQREGVRLA